MLKVLTAMAYHSSLIFIVPEDIVEVRPRLVLTFCAALMALQTGGM